MPDASENETKTNEETGQRLERELQELLNELRLGVPGLQFLFGFLLIVPFNKRFTEATALQRDMWFAALLLVLGTVACLIAPTAYHRIRFRDFDKERLVTTATRLAIVGLVLLASSLSVSAFFVTDVVFGDTAAAAVAAAAAVTISGLWFGLAATRKARS